MDEQIVQPVETQNPVSPIVPEEPKKNNNPVIIVLGLVILLAAFAGAVILLNNSSQTKEATPATTVTADQNAIKNTADLDKVSSQLDTTDLTTFETDLQQNDLDSSSF